VRDVRIVGIGTMIVAGPAVVVSAELASELLARLARDIARDPTTDAALLRLVAELREVAAVSAADSRRKVDAAPAMVLPLPEAAKVLGVPERTLRDRARAGTVRARRDGRRWLIEC
jgi:excisionase family DNA binding protein